VEILREAESGKLKLWVLDGHLENFIRVKVEIFEVKAAFGDRAESLTFLAMPNSATGETAVSYTHLTLPTIYSV